MLTTCSNVRLNMLVPIWQAGAWDGSEKTPQQAAASGSVAGGRGALSAVRLSAGSRGLARGPHCAVVGWRANGVLQHAGFVPCVQPQKRSDDGTGGRQQGAGGGGF